MTNPFETTIPKLESVSDKYKFIPTVQVIQDLQSLGFTPVMRYSPRRGMGLHAVDFISPKLDELKLDGISIRLRMYNAHDASAAFRFSISLLNGICANVLEPIAKHELESLNARIIHRGYALERLKAALTNVERYAENVVARVERLKATKVDDSTMARFALNASTLREAKPATLISLIDVRHAPQAENTAWNVFNRVQESLVRGGYYTQNAEGNLLRAREITSIRDVAKLNRNLWDLAEKVLLKGSV